MTIYTNTLKLINKELNFDKSNSKLVLEFHEDLIDFSAITFPTLNDFSRLFLSLRSNIFLSLEETEINVLPSLSSITWQYISLLLLKIESLGYSEEPEIIFLILFLILSLL